MPSESRLSADSAAASAAQSRIGPWTTTGLWTGEEFAFEDLESERVDFDGVEVSIATPATLYRMKKGTVRPRDLGDAQRLRERFGFEEE